MMFTRAFWLAALERASKTTAQTGLSSLSTLTVIQKVDWAVIGGTTALAALLSLLTSIASSGFGGNAGPSLAGEVLKPAA